MPSVQSEVAVLQHSLGAADSARWVETVEQECASAAGATRLRQSGMLEPAIDTAPPSAAARRRAIHRVLLYQVKKKLQRGCSMRRADDGTSGGQYHCARPGQVAARLCPTATPLLAAEDVRRLEADRIVVVDAALERGLVARAAQELLTLREAGLLRTDPDDLCNPLQTSYDVPLWEAEHVRQFHAKAPALAACATSLFALPVQLELELRLQLRVPQTLMLAAYPPGAMYRRHLDSYGGRDIPRFFTVLLYLAWSPRAGGELRVHGEAARALGAAPGAAREIAPMPGRLVVFYSQEVEHEVLPSVGERAAVTLWVWSETRDECGR